MTSIMKRPDGDHVSAVPAARSDPYAEPLVRTAPFFAAALVIALTFGAGLGALVLAARHLPWPALSTAALEAARLVHGHAQVFGFATLFVMGVAYHALPRMSGTALAHVRLARATLWLQTGGVVLLALSGLTGTLRGPIAVAAAYVLLAGALAFARVVETAATALVPTVPMAPWLRAGAWWLVAAAILDVAAIAGAPNLRPAVWDAALYGFVAAWIFGMSMQFLPALLHRKIAVVPIGLFLWYQLSVAAMVVPAAVLPAAFVSPGMRAGAGASLAAATLAMVVRLGVLARPTPALRAGQPVPDGAGASRFVVTAYVWLVVSLVCGPTWRAIAATDGDFLPFLVEDFARHALTLGFLTQMIVGVSSRLLPMFSGRPLWNTRDREATYWLLNAAIAARGLQVIVDRGGPWALWPWVAVSGPLAATGLLVFTAAIVRSARPARPV